MNAPDPEPTPAAPENPPVRRRLLRLVTLTAVRAWTGGIVGMSAQTAFWSALSLPPLLLGLLGSLGFVTGWIGPDTVNAAQREIIDFSATVFTESVVNQIVAPTVADILTQGHGKIVSVGFVLSLWAGSSALASLVDAITGAYGQRDVRGSVWQRTFALLLYVLTLVGSVFVLPVLALGPGVLPLLFPSSIRATVAELVEVFYYPGLGVLLVLVLATLYRVALPRKLPWRRGLPGALLAMAVFLVSSAALRFYISWVTRTGYTYGALATPIAFLLFAFFIAFAVIAGAHFNNAIDELWPAHTPRRKRRRLAMDRATARAVWRSEPAEDKTGRGSGVGSAAEITHPLRLPRNGARADDDPGPAGHPHPGAGPDGTGSAPTRTPRRSDESSGPDAHQDSSPPRGSDW